MSKRKRGDGETKSKSSNYQTIGGKKYDRGMIGAVEKATEDKDKIDIADCKKLLVEIVDGNKYTQIEKDTMKYIRENYKFENDADQWIRRAIASWAAKKANKEQKKDKEDKDKDLKCSCNEPDDGTLMVQCDARLAGCYTWYHARCIGMENKDSVPEVWFCDNCKKKGKKVGRGKKEKPKKDSYYKQIDNKKYDKGMLDAADAGINGKTNIGIADAKVIFQEAVDGDRITDCEYETLDYIKKNYSFTQPATTWLDKALAEWEVDHPRKKARAPRAAKKEKKEKKEDKKGKKAKGKGKPKKKKAKKDEEEEGDEEGDEEGEEEEKADKKENGEKADA
jgi:hypothetical protein